MPQADQDCIRYPTVTTLTRTEIEYLADRLYARGVSVLTTSTPVEQDDLVLASRALRRLLAAYERGSGRQLHALMLCGGA